MDLESTGTELCKVLISYCHSTADLCLYFLRCKRYVFHVKAQIKPSKSVMEFFISLKSIHVFHPYSKRLSVQLQLKHKISNHMGFVQIEALSLAHLS